MQNPYATPAPKSAQCHLCDNPADFMTGTVRAHPSSIHKTYRTKGTGWCKKCWNDFEAKENAARDFANSERARFKAIRDEKRARGEEITDADYYEE